ncbi:MAG: 16S rRNA (adenine(1518)-N(6)/adenine(1519)-N(6))-dimethyltransferase RsmA [Firmicutes bacterium]|nr:16S rRNA (adenine(1518)-N(6)/adenine(1519)-N(6))-dimethyltransferase RsmA [Bacillota bacterium]
MKIDDLIKQGFKFNKGLGQNFILDTNLLSAIVNDAGIDNDSVILEIGVGAGTLTGEIAKKAKKVIAFEIDDNLIPFLKETLPSNVQLIHQDILKVSHQSILDLVEGKKFKVVANLPYYITTPIIFLFLESMLPLDSITIMVQKEVANRMVALPKTSDYGALSLAIKARCDSRITRIVNRKMFIPPPNVDSAVVHMQIKNPYDEFLSKVIKNLFLMRRKTAINNLMSGFLMNRQKLEAIFNELGFNLMIRGEELGLEQVKNLARKLA